MIRSRKLWIIPVLCAVGLTGTAYAGAQSATETEAARRPPNIIFIHTDDLSSNLVEHMSAVRAMRRNGTAFKNHIVADGLCCPSRAALLTGRFPHHTKVLTNKNEDRGGNRAFVRHGNHKRTYAVALDRRYRTGLFGKYLNGYSITSKVPPGWDEWHVAGKGGYSNMGGSYEITNVRHQGDGKHISKPDKYMNDLLGVRTREFITRARRAHQPFFAQISTFAPHGRVSTAGDEPRFPPAKRDRPGAEFRHGDCGVKGGQRTDCRSLKVKRGTGFSDATYRQLDTDLRNRVRMMQSLNGQISAIRKHLTRAERANTYFVFSSDNGFHLGDHGLKRGKGTAYDHDSRVPLIVTGPGVKQGKVRSEIVQNIDLYATFQRMARQTPRRSDGHSVLGLAKGDSGARWREAALMEHTALRPGATGFDPDDEGDVAADGRFQPSRHTYRAIRTGSWLYVRYADSDRRELYDLRADPGQHRNVYRDHPARARQLNRWLTTLSSCGANTVPCWRAAQRPTS